MALKKEIKLNNGITTDYHRIANIDNIINKETRIIVFSYVNKEKREEEEQSQIEDEEPIFNVVNSDMISTEYNEDLTIEEAYGYLKTLDKFSGAEDC